jgi:hypothetical protein
VLVDDGIRLDYFNPEDAKDAFAGAMSKVFLILASVFAEIEGQRFVQRACGSGVSLAVMTETASVDQAFFIMKYKPIPIAIKMMTPRLTLPSAAPPRASPIFSQSPGLSTTSGGIASKALDNINTSVPPASHVCSFR